MSKITQISYIQSIYSRIEQSLSQTSSKHILKSFIFLEWDFSVKKEEAEFNVLFKFILHRAKHIAFNSGIQFYGQTWLLT